MDNSVWLPESYYIDAASLVAPVPRWECHVHSDYSDGSHPLSVMVEKAWQKGIYRLLFTEHTEEFLHTDPDWFPRYVEELRLVREEWAGRMVIGIGLEVPITDFSGGLLMSEEMAQEAEFILGAVHAYPGLEYGAPTEEAVDMELRGLLALVANPRVHAIAHPGGVCQKYYRPFPLECFEEVVVAAAQRGVAIELNPAYQDSLVPHFEICRRHGAKITFGSNVHYPDALGLAFKEMDRILRGEEGAG